MRGFAIDLNGKRLGQREGRPSPHADRSADKRFRVETGDEQRPLTVYQGKRPLVEVMGATDHVFSQDGNLIAVSSRNLDVYS